MNVARALVRVAEGPAVLCYPGDQVGRLASARVYVPDPRISEAHALFSLRANALWLLFLRQPARIRDERVWHVDLTSGMKVPLAEGLVMDVLEVQLGTERLALSVSGGPPLPIGQGKYAIVPSRWPFLVDDPGAQPSVWCAGDRYYLRTPAGVDEIEPGRQYEVNGVVLEASVEEWRGTSWTAMGQVPISTWVKTSPERATLRDERGTEGEIRGLGAAVLHALCRRGGKATWAEVAADLWGRKGAEQRENLYNNVLWRIDRTLREKGFRDDLIRRQDGALGLGPAVFAEEEAG